MSAIQVRIVNTFTQGTASVSRHYLSDSGGALPILLVQSIVRKYELLYLQTITHATCGFDLLRNPL